MCVVLYITYIDGAAWHASIYFRRCATRDRRLCASEGLWWCGRRRAKVRSMRLWRGAAGGRRHVQRRKPSTACRSFWADVTVLALKEAPARLYISSLARRPYLHCPCSTWKTDTADMGFGSLDGRLLSRTTRSLLSLDLSNLLLHRQQPPCLAPLAMLGWTRVHDK